MIETTEYLTATEKSVLASIASKLQDNNELEARSIVGYNELLRLINSGRETLTDEPNSDIIISYLDVLERDTREKISDELNHSTSLNNEYVELTGINIARI